MGVRRRLTGYGAVHDNPDDKSDLFEYGSRRSQSEARHRHKCWARRVRSKSVGGTAGGAFQLQPLQQSEKFSGGDRRDT